MRLRHRPVAFILLAVFTLAVQLGGLLHGLAHGLEPGGAPVAEEGGVAPSSPCATCVAFAALGTALPSAPRASAVPAWDAPPPPAAPPVLVVSAAPRTYRARAPPFLA